MSSVLDRWLTPPENRGNLGNRNRTDSEIKNKKLLTSSEKALQKSSSEWWTFCDDHQRSLPDQHCPVKHSRDKFTDCLGWQLKNKGQPLSHALVLDESDGDGGESTPHTQNG